MGYVYIRSEPELWTVGFYDPAGTWQPESDQGSAEDAAKRVAWLNGSPQDLAEAVRPFIDAALSAHREADPHYYRDGSAQ